MAGVLCVRLWIMYTIRSRYSWHNITWLTCSYCLPCASEEFEEAIKIAQQIGTLNLTVDGDVSPVIYPLSCIIVLPPLSFHPALQCLCWGPAHQVIQTGCSSCLSWSHGYMSSEYWHPSLSMLLWDLHVLVKCFVIGVSYCSMNTLHWANVKQ